MQARLPKLQTSAGYTDNPAAFPGDTHSYAHSHLTNFRMSSPP